MWFLPLASSKSVTGAPTQHTDAACGTLQCALQPCSTTRISDAENMSASMLGASRTLHLDGEAYGGHFREPLGVDNGDAQLIRCMLAGPDWLIRQIADTHLKGG